MAVFSLMAAIVYNSAKSMVTETVYYERSTQALAIAEAGVEDALHSLYSTSTWRAGFSQKSFAGGYYTVTVTTASASALRVASSGYSLPLLLIGRAVKTVSANVVFVSTVIAQNAVLANDLTVNGTIDAYDPRVSLTPSSGTFTSGVTIWSNNGIDTSGSGDACPRIFGDASYYSSPAPGGSCVTGAVAHSTYTMVLPITPCGTCATVNNNSFGIYPSTAYAGGASQILTIATGETVTLSSGTYFFKQVQFNGTGILNVDTTVGPVKIFYNNKWQESPGCAVNNLSKIPSRLLISDIKAGSHTVSLTCPVPLHAYLEGGTANFQLGASNHNNPSELYGRIIASQVTVWADSKLHYDISGGLPASHLGWTTGPSGSWAESYQRQ